MKVEILANIVADAGLGTLGETLFIHHMPQDCPLGILIRLPLTGMDLDWDLPGYIVGKLQIIIRSPTQAGGDELSAEVMRVLTIYETEYLDPDTGDFSMKINYLLPRSLPIVYPRSVGNLKEWSINFDCCYVVATI